MIRGIDCSADNANLDIMTIDASVRFVVTRWAMMGGQNYGSVVRDPTGPTYLAATEASGRLAGAYQYVAPVGATKPDAEVWGSAHAVAFLNILFQSHFWTDEPRLPLMLDLETLGTANADTICHYAGAWCATVRENQPVGRPDPVIYTGLFFWLTYLKPMQTWHPAPSWAIAAYQADPPKEPDWLWWQYTDAADVGYQGTVDGDYWTDRVDIEKYCALST